MAYGCWTGAAERQKPVRLRRQKMRQGEPSKTIAPWKHKAKVLAAFLALCLVTAYSGIGFAAA